MMCSSKTTTINPPHDEMGSAAVALKKHGSLVLGNHGIDGLVNPGKLNITNVPHLLSCFPWIRLTDFANRETLGQMTCSKD